eukprot:10701737-Karenia_brevis.AAC.1
MLAIQKQVMQMFPIQAKLLDNVRSQGELECIAIDGTFKVCMSVRDQPKHGVHSNHEISLQSRRAVEYHVVETITSKTGYLLGAFP